MGKLFSLVCLEGVLTAFRLPQVARRIQKSDKVRGELIGLFNARQMACGADQCKLRSGDQIDRFTHQISRGRCVLGSRNAKRRET
jgi:hypothetical protein